MEVVYPCLTDNLGAKVYSPYNGYEVLQKKNTHIKEVQVKSSYLVPCNSRESRKKLDNEMWSVERSSCTTFALDRFF